MAYEHIWVKIDNFEKRHKCCRKCLVKTMCLSTPVDSFQYEGNYDYEVIIVKNPCSEFRKLALKRANDLRYVRRGFQYV